MRGLTLVILLLIVAVVLVEFSECKVSRRRGKSSSGGSRSRARPSSSRRRGSTNRASRKTTRRHFSPAGSSRVYKNTPIPVYTSKSPVIVLQTKTGSRRSHFARNAFFGYMIYRYGFRRAPVYRRRYHVHRTTVEIPEERAIRLNFTKEIMLDSNGTMCLNSTKNYTIASDKNERVKDVFTSVRYSDLNGGRQKEYSGDNETVAIDMNALDQSVEVTTVVKYDGTIVANTTCTQIKSVMNGTVVRMYATNPDADEANSVQSSFLALISTSFIYFML